MIRSALTTYFPSIVKLDKSFSTEKLQHPVEVIRNWIENRSKDVIMMEDEGGLFGTIFTQLANTEFVDAKPWS